MNATSPNANAALRINIDNPHDVLAWADRLDVAAGDLRDAVVMVGDDAEAVALVLKGSATLCTAH